MRKYFNYLLLELRQQIEAEWVLFLITFEMSLTNGSEVLL